jgi:hypothetical protein
MSTSPIPSQRPPKPLSLAKLATVFAITFGIAFGLCTVSATVGMGANQRVAGFFIRTALVIEGICAISLFVIATIAIFNTIRNKR